MDKPSINRDDSAPSPLLLEVDVQPRRPKIKKKPRATKTPLDLADVSVGESAVRESLNRRACTRQEAALQNKRRFSLPKSTLPLRKCSWEKRQWCIRSRGMFGTKENRANKHAKHHPNGKARRGERHDTGLLYSIRSRTS